MKNAGRPFRLNGPVEIQTEMAEADYCSKSRSKADERPSTLAVLKVPTVSKWADKSWCSIDRHLPSSIMV
jgi:hypothetical protein